MMRVLLLSVLFGVAEASKRMAVNQTAAAFSAFMRQHSRSYEMGSEEYQMRYALFQKTVDFVNTHNSKPDSSWKAGVNWLADRTPAEFEMLHGYKRSESRAGSAAVGLASISTHVVDISHLPTDFTWKDHLSINVVNQGGCGSCWAVSSASVLAAHSELYQKKRTFSAQQILECTPNPLRCGGDGGCTGATAELAMTYVVGSGLVTEDEHKYVANDVSCPADMKPHQQTGTFLASSSQKRGAAAFGMTGWSKLPENALSPLLLALYNRGPVVVSVGASSWGSYSSGVMDACVPSTVINHAVMLVGYGKDAGKGYWQILNSWSSLWGEAGYIRLERRDHAEEGKYCGWDYKPLDGTGCKGKKAVDRVWVCGQCGILYDNVVPTFSLSEDGFLAKHTRNEDGSFVKKD